MKDSWFSSLTEYLTWIALYSGAICPGAICPGAICPHTKNNPVAFTQTSQLGTRKSSLPKCLRPIEASACFTWNKRCLFLSPSYSPKQLLSHRGNHLFAPAVCERAATTIPLLFLRCVIRFLIPNCLTYPVLLRFFFQGERVGRCIVAWELGCQLNK